MAIKYDQEADAMYVTLRKGTFHHNQKLNDNTIIDYDREGNIIGIELLFVSENSPGLLNDLIKKKMIMA